VSYELYKVLHLAGVMAVLAAVFGLALHLANGGTRESNGARVLVGLLHGLGLLVSLVAGFGLLGRLGLTSAGMPRWAVAKMMVWLLLAVAPALLYRWPRMARGVLIGMPLVAGLAAYLAVYKPG